MERNLKGSWVVVRRGMFAHGRWQWSYYTHQPVMTFRGDSTIYWDDNDIPYRPQFHSDGHVMLHDPRDMIRIELKKL